MQQMSRKNTMLARPQKVNLNHRGKSLAVAEESDELKASGSESISGRDTRSKDSGVGRAAANQRATMYNTVYNAGSKKRLLDEIDSATSGGATGVAGLGDMVKPMCLRMQRIDIETIYPQHEKDREGEKLKRLCDMQET